MSKKGKLNGLGRGYEVLRKGRRLRGAASRWIAGLLAVAMCFAAGCAPDGTVSGNGTEQPSETGQTSGTEQPSGAAVTTGVKDLMADRIIGHPDIALDAETYLKCGNAVADYALRLLDKCASSDENVMISPVSVVYALAMVANGAEGETLKELEEMVGVDIGTLNIFLNMYMNKLKSLDGDEITVNMADSIWFADSLEVKEDFLSKNAGSLGAEVYQTVFDDNAVNAVNSWVEKNTLGMIKKIIDSLSEEDRMCIMNAVAAKAKWAEPFKEANTHESEFKTEGGETRMVDTMYSTEDLVYISNENAVGFIKRYNGGMSFAALLPKEGMTTKELVESLTGDGLLQMLGKTSEEELRIALPKFKSESTITMNDMLKELGLNRIFNMSAELGGISDENLYVGSVLHKTYINVDEEGTEAAAVTAIILEASGYVETKEVILDRPFVYMIFDDDTCMPLFIGTFQK